MTRSLKLSVVFALAAVAVAGCKKKKEAPPQTPPEPLPSASATAAPTPAPKPPGLEIDPNGDWVQVISSHFPAQPNDPFPQVFRTVTVTSAQFKSADELDGGTAEIAIDLASIDSGNAMRNNSLKGPKYFDTAKNPQAIVKISNVKKMSGDSYSAQADITIMGATVTRQIEFEAFDKKDKTVRVRTTVDVTRSEFKVGQAEGSPDETAADKQQIKVQLTLTSA